MIIRFNFTMVADRKSVVHTRSVEWKGGILPRKGERLYGFRLHTASHGIEFITGEIYDVVWLAEDDVVINLKDVHLDTTDPKWS